MNPYLDTEYRRQHGPDQPRQRVQKMYPVFFQDGQINITRRKFVLRKESLEYDNIWGENLHGYVLDPRTATDIDCEEDLWRAEKVYKHVADERGYAL